MTTDAASNQSGPQRKRGVLRRFLGLLGIRVGEEQGQWLTLTRRFPLVVLAMGVCLLLGGGWFIHFSSTPRFCGSCHYMKPYVDSWKLSTHSNVSCSKCHFPPGWRGYLKTKLNGSIQLIKTITKTHGPRPFAEIEDAACLRGGCHETRLLDAQKEKLFKGKYRFSHVEHLTKPRRGIKLRCTSCHSQIVQGEHIAVTESVCFTCHFKGQTHNGVLEPVAGCTACHSPPSEPVKLAGGESFDHQPFLDKGVKCWKCHFDATQGTGEVPRQVCIECHNERDKLAKYEDPKFLHDWHVSERKVECFQCHSEIRHGRHPTPVAREASCATCHSAGHGLQGALFAGRGGKGVEDSPSMHSAANVDCVACHEGRATETVSLPGAMGTRRATEKACLECHGPGMKGTLEMWVSAVDDALADAKAELKKGEDALAAAGQADNPQRARAQSLLEDARYNCEFVEKAHGVHNPEYALDLLDKAVADTKEAARIASRPGEATAATGKADAQ